MDTWHSATREEVETILMAELKELHPVHRRQFESIRVTPKKVPVTSAPGEYVYVIAEHDGKILYWSDIEDGWELEASDAAGGIAERGSSQFELRHIMEQIFGSPNGAC